MLSYQQSKNKTDQDQDQEKEQKAKERSRSKDIKKIMCDCDDHYCNNMKNEATLNTKDKEKILELINNILIN